MATPARKIRYVQDRAGTNRLMNSPEMLAMLMGRARAGRAFAESIAPRYTGTYARSFIVEGRTHAGPKNNRAEARLVNTSDDAVFVEYGGGAGGTRTPAHRVLARTVDVIERGGE